GLRLDLQGLAKASRELDADGIQDHVREALDRVFEEKEAQVGAETMRALEKHIMLSVLDENWKQHLARMDYLRQGIHLRGYAQKQPKQEYKREAFELFSEMLDKVKREVIMLLARVRVRTEEEVAAIEAQERAQAEARLRQAEFQHADAGGYGADEEAAQPDYQHGPRTPLVREGAKIGRNAPCPCGSGKQYKRGDGQLSCGQPLLHHPPARIPPERRPRHRGGRAGSMPGKPVAPLAGPPAWKGRSNSLPRLRERVGVGASRWRQCPEAPLPTSIGRAHV